MSYDRSRQLHGLRSLVVEQVFEAVVVLQQKPVSLKRQDLNLGWDSDLVLSFEGAHSSRDAILQSPAPFNIN